MGNKTSATERNDINTDGRMDVRDISMLMECCVVNCECDGDEMCSECEDINDHEAENVYKYMEINGLDLTIRQEKHYPFISTLSTPKSIDLLFAILGCGEGLFNLELKTDYGNVVIKASPIYYYHFVRASQYVSDHIIALNGKLDLIPIDINYPFNTISICRKVVGGGPRIPHKVLKKRVDHIVADELISVFGLCMDENDGFRIHMGDIVLHLPVTINIMVLLEVLRKYAPVVLKTALGIVVHELVPGMDVFVQPVLLGGKGKPKKKKSKQSSTDLMASLEARLRNLKVSPPRPAGAHTLPKSNKKKKNSFSSKLGNGFKSGQSLTDNSKNWKRTMLDIFNPKFRGTKLPGDNRFPTNTFIRDGTINIITGGSFTNACYALCPNAYTAFVSVQKLNSNVEPCSVTTGMQNYTANPAVWECANSWSNLVACCRMTGIGWKVRLNMPVNVVTGRLIVVPFPDVTKYYGVNALYNNTMTSNSTAASQLLGGGAPSILSSSSIFNMPGAIEYTLADLVGQDLLLRSKIVSDDVFTFKTVNGYGTYNATLDEGAASLYTASTGLTVQYDNPDDGRLGNGWTGYLMYFEGCPSTTPTFDISYMYQFEGMPNTAGTNDGAYASSSIPDTGFDRKMMDDAIHFSTALDAQTLVEGGKVITYELMGAAAKAAFI